MYSENAQGLRKFAVPSWGFQFQQFEGFDKKNWEPLCSRYVFSINYSWKTILGSWSMFSILIVNWGMVLNTRSASYYMMNANSTAIELSISMMQESRVKKNPHTSVEVPLASIFVVVWCSMHKAMNVNHYLLSRPTVASEIYKRKLRYYATTRVLVLLASLIF